MDLTIERLAKFVDIYECFHKILDDDIDATLYDCKDSFKIEFADYPNLKIIQKENCTITYVNHTRTVYGLTCDKCYQRVINFIGGKNGKESKTDTKVIE